MSYGTFNSATFFQAQIAGEQGMAISLDKAEKHSPGFAEAAKEAILAHLKAVGQASGEDLVEIAKAHGAVPENGDRAFGGIFNSLRKGGQIVCLRSDLPRKRGHGTSGGRLWAIGAAA